MTRINNLIFTLFVSFSILNLYTLKFIQMVGKFGKTIIIPYIVIYFIYKIIKNKIIKIDFIMLLFFIFFIVGSINYLFHTGKYDGMWYSLIFISYIIYFYYYLYEFKKSYGDDFFQIFIIKFRNILLLNFFFGFAIALIIHQPLWVPNKNGFDFGGFLGTSLLFGWLSLSLFLSLYISKKKKALDYIFIIIAIIFIYLSGGRGAQFALLSFGLFILYFKLKYVYLHYYFFIIFRIILLLVLAILLYSFILDFSFDILNEISTGRLFIWDIAIKNIFYNNIFYYGYGIGTYPDYLLNKYLKLSYYFLDLKQSNGALSLHSSYLAIISAGGIISLIGFLLIINKAYIKNADYTINALILSLLMGGLVEQFIISPNIPISTLFWIVIISALTRQGIR